MSDETVRVQTGNRSAYDIATELTKAMIEQKIIVTIEEVAKAFQAIFNVAYFAPENVRKHR